MKYTELKEKHSKEIDSFPMFFAFNNKQFDEGMQKLGVTDKTILLSIPGGGFIRKADSTALSLLFSRQQKERQDLLKDRTCLIDALIYELNNHEFNYTYDPEQALNTLGLSLENKLVNECYQIASAKVLENEQNK